MRNIISLNGQNIWDLAIRHMGSVDSVFSLLALNPAIRIDTTIPTGTQVFLPDNPTNQRVVEYYELNNINPSTSIL